jgi:hypothetical protein
MGYASLVWQARKVDVQIAYVDVRQPGGWEFTSKYTRLRGQRVLEPRFGTDLERS